MMADLRRERVTGDREPWSIAGAAQPRGWVRKALWVFVITAVVVLPVAVLGAFGVVDGLSGPPVDNWVGLVAAASVAILGVLLLRDRISTGFAMSVMLIVIGAARIVQSAAQLVAGSWSWGSLVLLMGGLFILGFGAVCLRASSVRPR